MDEYELGHVIAEREYSYADGGTLVIRIGAPQPFPEHTSYFCAYEWIDSGKVRTSRAGGVDAIQALQIVLNMIAVDLYVFNESKNNTIRWEDADEGDICLDLPPYFLKLIEEDSLKKTSGKRKSLKGK